MSPIVPFSISTDGLDEITGFAYLEGEFLVLDVNVAFLGLGSKQKERVKVAPSALARIEAQKRIGGRVRLVLHPSTPDLYDAVPGPHKGLIKLNVPRKHREDARALAVELEGRLMMA